MARRDLRTDEHTLHPLAPFMVLAVMCYPGHDEQHQRDRMLSTLRAGTKLGKVRAAVLEEPAFLAEVDRHAAHGGLAGHALLDYLRQHALGQLASLNVAIDHARTFPDPWGEKHWPYFNPTAHLTHMPHSRRKVQDALKRYWPSAHLWAALVHGLQNGRKDIFPDSNENLPVFLAYAHQFAAMAAQTPFRGRTRRVLLPEADAWFFLIPERLIRSVKVAPSHIERPDSHPVHT